MMSKSSRFPYMDINTLVICGLALTSFLFITISTFTDYWLYEMSSWTISVLNPNFDSMHGNSQQLANETEKMRKQFRSNSGLWRLCCAEGPCNGNCRTLNKLKEVLEAKGVSSPSAYIIGILRNSNVFPILSILLVLFGGILFVSGKFWWKPKMVTSLTGGIFFVMSGLSNVLGLIIYISNNDKLSKSGDLPKYGWSFYLAGLAFILTEVAGVLIVQNIVPKIESDADDEENEDRVGYDVDSKEREVKYVAQPPCMVLRRQNRLSTSRSFNSQSIDDQTDDMDITTHCEREDHAPTVPSYGAVACDMWQPGQRQKQQLQNFNNRNLILDRIDEGPSGEGLILAPMSPTSADDFNRHSPRENTDCSYHGSERNIISSEIYRSDLSFLGFEAKTLSDTFIPPANTGTSIDLNTKENLSSENLSNLSTITPRRSSYETENSRHITSFESIPPPVEFIGSITPGAENMNEVQPNVDFRLLYQTLRKRKETAQETFERNSERPFFEERRDEEYNAASPLFPLEGGLGMCNYDEHILVDCHDSANTSLEPGVLGKREKKTDNGNSLRSRVLRSLAVSGGSSSVESACQSSPTIPRRSEAFGTNETIPEIDLLSRHHSISFSPTYRRGGNVRMARESGLRTKSNRKRMTNQEIERHVYKTRPKEIYRVDSGVGMMQHHNHTLPLAYDGMYGMEGFGSSCYSIPNGKIYGDPYNDTFDPYAARQPARRRPIRRSVSANVLCAQEIKKRPQKVRSVTNIKSKLLRVSERRKDWEEYIPKGVKAGSDAVKEKIKEFLTPKGKRRAFAERHQSTGEVSSQEHSTPMTGSTAV